MGLVPQRSFASGEIAPAIYPRVDMTKYALGLRTCRNFFVRKHGGISNRPGTEFVAEIKDSSKVSRLIPYAYTDDLTFVLEFGDGGVVRVHHEGSQARNASQNISGVTNANPGVLTYAGADNYANGDHVYISGIVGAIGNYLNGRVFKVANLNAGANTFELNYVDGTAVNTTSMGSYTSGGTIAEVHELAGSSSWTEARLFDLSYAQDNDDLVVTHTASGAYTLTSTAETSWAIAATVFGPGIAGAVATAVASAGTSFKYEYIVTSVDADTYEESLAGYVTSYNNTLYREQSRTITGATAANPAVITTSGNHGFQTGNVVYITNLRYFNGGTITLNSTYTVTVLSATTFSIPENASTYGAFLNFTDGYCGRQYTTIHSNAPTSAAPVVVSWSAIANAREYNIYKAVNGQAVFGYLGSSTTTAFHDEGGTPDYLDGPPEDRVDPFGSNGFSYPSVAGVVGTIQQRRAFAKSDTELQKMTASKVGLPNNFTVHVPLADDDSVSLTLAGPRNDIRHILDLDVIVLLTASGEWILEGDSGVLTPTQINPKQVGYNGAAKIKPVLVNNNALFVQARGNIVRDMAYQVSGDGYKGNDLTIFSSHLFEGYTIVDWAYQQVPNSIVWAVRSDGVLLGLTYLREHDIWAWHRHDFEGGTVESVAVVPEGEEDALYLIVKRTINGATKRYVERMHTRVVDDIVDSVFMDSSKTFDGRHTGSTTMTLSGGTNWTYDETLTLTASASTFASTDVGKAVHLTSSDGTVIRFTITEYTGVTVVTGKPHMTVPAAMRSVAIGNGSGSWALAISALTGLWHLEGEAVSIFADGYVIASPNNDSYTTYTVTNGAITLDRPYAVIHVGLPYTSDFETLDIDTVQGETLADKKKAIGKFLAWFEDSRGLYVGPKPPTDDDDDPLEGLYEMRWRDAETSMEEPPELFTGTKDSLIKSEWNNNGRVFGRQIDPLPVSVLAIAPSGMIPFRTGG